MRTTTDFISIFKLNNICEEIPLYNLLLTYIPQVLSQYMRFFIVNDVLKFNTNNQVFDVIDIDNDNERVIGHIGADNFIILRDNVKLVLGLKSTNKNVKYGSERARKLVESIQKHKEKIKNKDTDNDLDNMVLKFCSNNKSGINMLNVGNLTYYQFIKLFQEYIYARQSENLDAIATNSFSYQESANYNPMMWMKKISDSNE